MNDQLMFHVLQQAMSEVVRSQADGVLTDEVVEQLLDTTCVDSRCVVAVWHQVAVACATEQQFQPVLAILTMLDILLLGLGMVSRVSPHRPLLVAGWLWRV